MAKQEKFEINPDASVQQAQAVMENKPHPNAPSNGGQTENRKSSPKAFAASQTNTALTCAGYRRWVGRCLDEKIGVVASTEACTDAIPLGTLDTGNCPRCHDIIQPRHKDGLRSRIVEGVLFCVFCAEYLEVYPEIKQKYVEKAKQEGEAHQQ